MGSDIFNKRSEENAIGVHPDLIKVMRRGLELSVYYYELIHGLRTQAQEDEYVAQGRSQTSHSRHIHGFAVDIAALINGSVNWSSTYYKAIYLAVQKAADELNIKIVWGGNWHTLKDLGHYELDRLIYPDPVENLA